VTSLRLQLRSACLTAVEALPAFPVAMCNSGHIVLYWSDDLCLLFFKLIWMNC